MGPLRGIHVLDLSRVLAGPWATQLLADFGAQVIKVERPGTGDETRGWGPPYLADELDVETGESAYFLSANRGKRSIAVNLAHADGQRIVRELAATADVLVENFRVGDLARYGLGYEPLREANQGLVYCSISAFGQTGPEAASPGYDAMIQARAGLMSVTGVPDGQPGAGPQKVGVAVADLMAGMYAATAILGALFERERTRVGQYIDLSLLDTQVAALANQGMSYLVSGRSPQRHGTAHPNIVPYQSFATADGYMMLAVGNDRQFASLCAVLGCAELPADERFATNPARVANRAALVVRLQTLLSQRATHEWLEKLTAARVPCGPISDIAQVFADSQVVRRGMRLELRHPSLGRVPSVKNPINFSHSSLEYERAPPLLGEHTEEILRERLGRSPEEVAKLRDSGAIGVR